MGSDTRPKLNTPAIHVVPAEGEAYDVQAINADMVAYDVTAYKHKWPPMGKAPMLWLTFLAWHASRRTGVIGLEIGYESFRDTTLEISAPDEDSGVPPTQEDPGSDY